MNEQTTRSAESSHQIAPQIAPLKFGVGQPVSRKEDPILLTGQGRYTDDLSMPGQAWAAVLRAPVAHGRIVRLDTEAARALPGVLAVYTAADMDAAGYKGFRCGLPLKSGDGTPLYFFLDPSRTGHGRDDCLVVHPSTYTVTEPNFSDLSTIHPIADPYVKGGFSCTKRYMAILSVI